MRALRTIFISLVLCGLWPNAGEGQSASPSPQRGGGGDASTSDFRGTVGVIERPREAGSQPSLLRAVRAARHANFDRVVFEFAGAELPGYRVEYVNGPVHQCGSGAVVPVAGDGHLLVRLKPAQAHNEAGSPTVRRRTMLVRLPNLKELKAICDFEGEVEWALGLSTPNRYRVLELSEPARLVIDIKH